jgi:hypothetical protein
MAVISLRPGSILGRLFVRRTTNTPRTGPSAVRKLLRALGLVLGPLVVPMVALGCVTFGVWQWSEPVGWVMLGVSLLILDGIAPEFEKGGRR